MPQNLTGNPASFPTQTAPVGGDPRTASSVSTPLQNAADRTEYVRDRILYVDPDKTGVRKFRETLSTGTLQALTDHNDGEHVYVTGLGLMYRYYAASTDTVSTYSIIKPSDVGGAGRWHALLLTSGAGFPLLLAGPLTATGKVPTSQLVNSTTQFANQAQVSGTLPANSVLTLGTSKTLTSLVAGDVITVLAHALGGSSNSFFTIDPASATDLTGGVFNQKLTGSASFGVSGVKTWLVTAAIASRTFGPFTATDSAGASSTVTADWSIYVVRP